MQASQKVEMAHFNPSHTKPHFQLANGITTLSSGKSKVAEVYFELTCNGHESEIPRFTALLSQKKTPLDRQECLQVANVWNEPYSAGG